MKKILLIPAMLCLLSIFAGCNEKTAEEKLPINVIAEKVIPYDADHAISYSGTIEEANATPLCFPVVGTVEKVFVSEGDHVRKGQVLATLKSDNYQNSYEMMLASEQQAEDAIKRLEPMYKSGNLSEIKWVEAKTALQQAKAAAMIAKRNVEDCRLISPVEGYVGKRSIEPGMSALPNLVSITILDINKVFARTPVPENEISAIKKGQAAVIKVPALGDESFQGKTEELGVVADFLSHSYKIKIAIPNKNLRLKPGMVCNVMVMDGKKVQGLIVPERSVSMDEEKKTYVFVVENGKAVKKIVQTGALKIGGIEITSGLNGNEAIVTSGQQKLVDGSPVKVLNNGQIN